MLFGNINCCDFFSIYVFVICVFEPHVNVLGSKHLFHQVILSNPSLIRIVYWFFAFNISNKGG